MNTSEIWETRVVLNPLSTFFKHLFDSVGLLDIAPSSAGPTWRNGHVGEHGISKRLDRFLVASSLIPSLLTHRVWTHHSDISDHFPVCFEWNKSLGPHNYPFKFNRSWLLDQDFSSWFTECWPKLTPTYPSSELEWVLTHKLYSLKKEVKVCIKDKCARMDANSKRLDLEMSSLLTKSSFGILSQEEQLSLSRLRSEKKKILDHHLLTWQFKSRTKWALEGDSNTKFFHTVASSKRNQNSIWSLMDEGGRCV